ncbi:hypothetical protein OGAPHI_005819 [Ogataea philodendri]|uniref:FAD/NAD(P)-binding domain-containing protein n=1 Tax=Ogataea philodendri TaxID=1378263 RepID=A0A9P8NZR5_9ASCO|nr:uncharacterized protein OGAPHI_005819 [Ogataea philodendri]KAH3662567.1 hypothetical protein OGAPHI_005819 [Ogataea philodendri]
MSTVVIVGGGLYGVVAAMEFEKKSNIKVVLISNKDYVYFVPSLPRMFIEKATKGWSAQITKLLKDPSVFVQDEVIGFDENRVITASSGEFKYDALVLASGSKLEEIWDLPASTKLAVEHFKVGYEKIAKAKNITVVGGGLSGVELVGEIAAKFKSEIKSGEKTLNLIHSQKLPLTDSELTAVRNSTKAQLEELNVNLYLGRPATVNGDAVMFGEKEVPTDHLIWCTGGKPNVPKNSIEGLQNEKNEVKVHDTLQSVAVPQIFATGDCCDTFHKSLLPLKERTKALLANVDSYLNGKPLTVKVNMYRKETDRISRGVSLGPDHGAGQAVTFFGVFSAPKWLVVRLKSRNMFRGELHKHLGSKDDAE